MPPQKLPPKKPQCQQRTPAPKAGTKPTPADKPLRNSPNSPAPPQQPQIPEQDIKQSSSVSAGRALEAGKKAYELRQAAAAAGDPDAREEILGKAINKEIEAESFGKAAKYTRSGAFQGLAAGAGVGIQPGATIGKLTGALVGGLLSTVGGLLGGGIGSAYGAINGPIWDLGAMASHGVRNVVGDFIGDWPDTGSSTKHQKDTLEKMVLGAQNTKPPNESELEEMHADDGGASQESYQQFAKDMTSYLPSLDSMPDFGSVSRSIPSMPNSRGGSNNVPGWSLISRSGDQGKIGDSSASAPTAGNEASLARSKQVVGGQTSGQGQRQHNKAPKLQPRSKVRHSPKKVSEQDASASKVTRSGAATTHSKPPAGAKDLSRVESKAPKNNNAHAQSVQSGAFPEQQPAPLNRRAPPKLGPRRPSAAAAA